MKVLDERTADGLLADLEAHRGKWRLVRCGVGNRVSWRARPDGEALKAFPYGELTGTASPPDHNPEG